MPITAQPSCGRPSSRIPLSLRPSIQMSFGHLMPQRAAANASQASATATGTPSGSSASRRVRSRTSTDTSSALPGGADHVRPCRPRPALCSAAVTTVPSGAPASASSRARAFVESVTR
jgi:hypothetical protein